MRKLILAAVAASVVAVGIAGPAHARVRDDRGKCYNLEKNWLRSGDPEDWERYERECLQDDRGR